jgi:hypothetical protein
MEAPKRDVHPIKLGVQPWTWGQVLPGLFGVFASGLFVFRFWLGLSWSGTLLMVGFCFAAAAAFLVAFWSMGRRGVIMLPKGSLRARALASALKRDKADLLCSECGWHGHISGLVRSLDEQKPGQLCCPACGHTIGRQLPAAAAS